MLKRPNAWNMKAAPPYFLLLSLQLLVGCAHTSSSLWHSERDLAHYREQAVAAIDSPELWQRFEKPQNARHTAAREPVDYVIDSQRPETLEVIVPIVETVSLHKGYVAVGFSRRSGEIVRMYEGCWP